MDQQSQDSHGHHGSDVYTILNNASIYLYGACFPVGESNALHKEVIVYGNLKRPLKEDNFTCCLQYVYDGSYNYTESNVLRDELMCSQSKIQPRIFVCDVPNTAMVNPVGVSITVEKVACSKQPLDYVRPYHPRAQPHGSLAILNKVVYGKVNSESIIEWIEAYRALGVDKIVTYMTSDTNMAARRVLDYYNSTGFLDLHRYDLAATDYSQRNWTEKRYQIYCDANIPMIDARFKTAGYEYYGIIDLDEILIPSDNRSLKQLLTDLRRQEPNAAAFKFKSKYYYTSWGISAKSDLSLQQYVNASPTEPYIDRPKMLQIQNRTDMLYISTHGARPLADFQTVTAPAREAYIRHYRTCRNIHTHNGLSHDQCMTGMERQVNRSVADWSTRIEGNVRGARRAIFGDNLKDNVYLHDYLKFANWD